MKTFLTPAEQVHVVVMALISVTTAYYGELVFFSASLFFVVRLTSLVAQRVHPQVEIVWWGLLVSDPKHIAEKSNRLSIDAIRLHVVIWWMVVVACLLATLVLGAHFSPFILLFGDPMR